MNDRLSEIERRIRQKAAYEHSVKVKEAMKALTGRCYYGENRVPRLTLRVEKEQEDGTFEISHRAPTIIEVGNLLAQAIADFEGDTVATQAVNEFISKHT